MEIASARLRGCLNVPASKSHTIRSIVAALLADGTSHIRHPLASADTLAVLKAAELLGAAVAEEADGWMIQGTAGAADWPSCTLNLDNSGTGLRFLAAAAALGRNIICLDGDASLRTRIMHGEFEALRKLGATVSGTDCSEHAPCQVRGPLLGGDAEVDGITSQYLSALLLALPLAPCESRLSLAYLNEAGYVEMTLHWLERCGIQVEVSRDGLHYRIPGRQSYRTFDYTIPADFSAASFGIAAGILCGREDGIRIPYLDFADCQGDKAVPGFFRQMGANIRIETDGTLIASRSSLHGISLDMNATPDALPIMAVAAAFADGETRLFNVPQARLKETDRIAVMARELRKTGIRVDELPDGMVIAGGCPHAAVFDCDGDHRIAMALAVAAMAIPGTSTLNDAECVSVSWPMFFKDISRLKS